MASLVCWLKRDLPAACGQLQSHMNKSHWSWLRGRCQGPGNVHSSRPLCLVFDRAELGLWSHGKCTRLCLEHFCMSSRYSVSLCAELESRPASACRLRIPRTCLPLESLERGHGPIAGNGLGRVQTAGS